MSNPPIGGIIPLNIFKYGSVIDVNADNIPLFQSIPGNHVSNILMIKMTFVISFKITTDLNLNDVSRALQGLLGLQNLKLSGDSFLKIHVEQLLPLVLPAISLHTSTNDHR